MRFVLSAVAGLVALVAAYFWVVLSWNYSTGERAGWVQKLSQKGWVCKTWEGELSMIAMPGAAPEKFFFTVQDDQVAEEINRSVGKRVALHYEQKVGLPGSCFGETRYYITKIKGVDEMPFAAGAQPPQSAPVAPAALPASAAAK